LAADKGDKEMKPTPSEIHAAIASIKAGECAYMDLEQFWLCHVHDATGGYAAEGYGRTETEAMAGAWINAWWPDIYLWPNTPLVAVPRIVPDGWTFETYAPQWALH
jgi:hypothetical protein